VDVTLIHTAGRERELNNRVSYLRMRAGSVRGEVLLLDLDVCCDDLQSIASNLSYPENVLRAGPCLKCLHHR
jgi:hypothetical protein